MSYPILPRRVIGGLYYDTAEVSAIREEIEEEEEK